jgi:hypothetical protein
MGLMGGLALGGVCLFGAEFVDDRVYDEKEFKKLVAVDVMADIPPLPTPQEESRLRRRWLLEAGLAGLMSLATLAGVAFSYLRG